MVFNLPGGKNPPTKAGRCKRRRLDSWLRKIPWRRAWQPTPVLVPGKSHWQKSLIGCSPWGHKESDMTERLHFHFSLSCIGEENSNPLQCSCLDNPRDGGSWWSAVYGVAKSWTRLMRLSSSSSWIIEKARVPEKHLLLLYWLCQTLWLCGS